MSNDYENVTRENNIPGRRDDVREQRPAARLMQNFGMFGFKPRSFSGGHDDHSQAGGTGSSGRLLAAHENNIPVLRLAEFPFRQRGHLKRQSLAVAGSLILPCP